jgi:hypothetical protein
MSPDIQQCTWLHFQKRSISTSHLISVLTLWDTAGLNEGDVGTVPSCPCTKSLTSFPTRVSLLVFVIRGPHIKGSTQHNRMLFNKVICQNGVPSIVVVTGMENLAVWMAGGRRKRMLRRSGTTASLPLDTRVLQPRKGERQIMENSRTKTCTLNRGTGYCNVSIRQALVSVAGLSHPVVQNYSRHTIPWEVFHMREERSFD